MGIIACSIVSKDIPENKVKQLPTILKRETVERKDSIKLNWYQQKDISLLSKKKNTESTQRHQRKNGCF